MSEDAAQSNVAQAEGSESAQQDLRPPPTQGEEGTQNGSFGTSADAVHLVHGGDAPPPKEMDVAQPQPTASADARSNLIVNYLPPTVTEPDLLTMFSPYGKVTSHKLMVEPSTGRSRCYAFIKYETIEEANAAIQALNGHEMLGKRLRVAYSRPKGEAELKTNVYVAHLPPDTTQQSVLDTFNSFDKDGEFRGVAFVKFQSHEAANAAIAGMNGVILPGQSTQLLVKFADSKEDKKKNYGSGITGTYGGMGLATFNPQAYAQWAAMMQMMGGMGAMGAMGAMGVPAMGMPQAGAMGAGMGVPAMGMGVGQSGMGQGAMATMAAGMQPTMGMMAPQQQQMSAMASPSMGQAGMGQAGMGQAGMGQAGMGQAGMGQAGMGQSAMVAGGMGQAAMGHAAVGQSGVGQSAMGGSMQDANAHTAQAQHYAAMMHGYGTGGVLQQQQQGQDSNAASVFVYNLPSVCDDSVLYQYFLPFGPIASVKVVRDNDTGNCKGFGFVHYSAPASAVSAMASMNGFMLPHGKRLQVKPATGRKMG